MGDPIYPQGIARVLGLKDFLEPGASHLTFSTFEIDTALSLEGAKYAEDSQKGQLVASTRRLLEEMKTFEKLYSEVYPLHDLTKTQELFMQMEEWLTSRRAFFEKGTPFYLVAPLDETSRVMVRSEVLSEEFKQTFGSHPLCPKALALFMEDPTYQCHYRFGVFETSDGVLCQVAYVKDEVRWPVIKDLPPNHSARVRLPWSHKDLVDAPIRTSEIGEDLFLVLYWLGEAFVDPSQRRPFPWLLSVDRSLSAKIQHAINDIFYLSESQAKECWVQALGKGSITVATISKMTGLHLSWRTMGTDQRLVPTMKPLEGRPTHVALPSMFTASYIKECLAVFYTHHDHPFSKVPPKPMSPRAHVEIKSQVDLWSEIILTRFHVFPGSPMDIIFKEKMDQIMVQWCVEHDVSFSSLKPSKTPMEFLHPVQLFVSKECSLMPDKEKGYFIVGLNYDV